MIEGIAQDQLVNELLGQYEDHDELEQLLLESIDYEEDDPDEELEAAPMQCLGFCGELTTNPIGMCYQCQCVQHELGMIDMDLN